MYFFFKTLNTFSLTKTHFALWCTYFKKVVIFLHTLTQNCSLFFLKMWPNQLYLIQVSSGSHNLLKMLDVVISTMDGNNIRGREGRGWVRGGEQGGRGWGWRRARCGEYCQCWLCFRVFAFPSGRWQCLRCGETLPARPT